MSSSDEGKTKGRADAASSPNNPGTILSEPSSSKFTADGVRDYEKKRYRGIDQRIVQAREIRILKKIFRSVKGTRPGPGPILDLPCGYGRFSSFLLGQGLGLVNTDLSFHMVKRACQKIEEAGGAVSGDGSVPGPSPKHALGVVGNAKQGLPFRKDVFPVVFSIRFFHHVHDPPERETILGEFLRVSSAWAVVSFYRMNALHLFQRRLRRLVNKSRTRIKMIEPGRFEQEAEAAGFEVMKIYPLIRGVHAYHIALLKKPSLD
jgi:SAM-dependent methyltransferase